MARFQKKEVPKSEERVDVSIQKVEDFNGEMIPQPYETDNNMRMNDDDKVRSMKNAVMILPPNLIVNGRHTKQNIQAICGFIVTDSMMNKVYKDFKHEV
jgi:hypothetical protein